ncbi:MAG TPA: branched-chain amino acid ABC transporter substrate-binding protein [Ktedonobacteraceae bacterium]|nr:branched-chain amino acid ABC transporter substrate-binding protein [Ktedonobacteraceae bacterium]
MRRSWSRILALTMGIPLLLAILVACGSGASTGSSTPTGGSTTIKVATDLPVSGKDESGGKPAENGAHLAVDQANANKTIPGYTLQFVPKDDVGPSGAHDPAVGKANVTALIGDALVAGIVGPFNSGVAKAEMPIANQAPIALISPSNTNPCLTQNTPASGCTGSNDQLSVLRPTGQVTYFRIATTDDHQGGVGADLLYKELNFKKVYVVDDAEAYGIGVADAFTLQWKNDGGTVLGRSSEPGTTTSYVSLLTSIASMHPDVVYFGGTDATGGTLFRQQFNQVPGLKNTPMGGGDGIVTGDFAKTVAPLKGGAVYGTIGSVDVTSLPSAQAFVNAYKAVSSYGQLGAYSANAYDCMNILIQAIKNAISGGATTPKDSGDAAGAKTFRQAVIDQIKKTDYTGPTGHHTFDANGDTTNKVISVFLLTNLKTPCDNTCWKFQKTIIAK